VQPLDCRTDLFANRRAQDRVSSIEALSRDYPARDVIGAQRLARSVAEHAKAEPREFIAGKVAIAPIEPLRSDRFQIEIGREIAQRAVYVRQVGPVLV
jgi:hypothetical protein